MYSPIRVLGSPLTNTFLHRNPVLPNKQKKVVMVTGAAGFIGYHLASAIATGSVDGVRHKVVAIDNFNNYYDVNLKHVSKFVYLLKKQ